MADISTWSPTDASNSAAPPDGWPENQQPSSVNNCARGMMGAIRRWYDTVTAQLASITTSLGNYVLKSGDTMTGTLSAPFYRISGVSFAGSDGTTTSIFDPTGSGLAAIQLQAATSYYNADLHDFRNKAGSITASVNNVGDLAAARDINSVRDINAGRNITGGAITATGILTGSGAYVNANAYYIGGVPFATHGGIGETLIYDGGGGAALNLQANDSYYDQNNHRFRNSAASPTFTLDIAGNGGFAGSVTSGGTITGTNLAANSNITASGSTYSTGGFTTTGPNGGSTFQMVSITGYSYVRFLPNWYWEFNASGDSSSGAMVWFIDRSGPKEFWYMRPSDSMCLNYLGPVAGLGAYVNTSDRRGKKNIVPSQRGLAEVLELTPVEFDRISDVDTPREIGFIAQDVKDVMPEAVRVVGIALPDGTGGLGDPEPTLGLTDSTIVAALVNAVKELSTRLVALEGEKG